jgi:DNA topoisomerase-1
MAAALFDNTTVDIEAKRPHSRTKYLLRTTTSVITFPGFMTLYIEGLDEGNEEGRKKSLLPHLEKGDELNLLELFPEQHFTQPPPRFTEATLVKTLEQWGIGRPSTYAPILSTIQEREYVTKTKGRFQPSELGCVVNDLLVKHFSDIVDIEFTARMEKELDEIANENRDWVSVVQDFYTPFKKSLTNASEVMERVKLADELVEETCPQCDKPLAIKMGRFGKFLACSGYPECKFTKPYQIKIGVNCPECGSEMIQRLSKKRRIFYGCSNYPNCQFASYLKPLPKPCPSCGGLLTLYRGKQAKCTKCSYKGKIEQG